MADTEVTIWLRIRDKATAHVKRLRKEFPALARVMAAAAAVARRAWSLAGTVMSWVGRQLRRAAMLAAAFASYMAQRFVRGIIEAGAQAEAFGMQMVKAFGGVASVAKNAMKWVREFAAKTPFMTDEVVQSFIMLKNIGIKNVREVITASGDAAFMMNRQIIDVSMGFISLLARVWRRLGVQIDRTGKKAVISASGIRREVENNLDAVRAALLEVLQYRFGGAMKTAERTWRGMVALLLSEWWEFKVRIAESGVFQFLKAGLSLVLKEIQKMKETGELDKWAQSISDSIVTLIYQLSYLAYQTRIVAATMRVAVYSTTRLGQALINLSTITMTLSTSGLVLMSKTFRDFLAKISADVEVTDANLKMAWEDLKAAYGEEWDSSRIGRGLKAIQDEMKNVTSGMDDFGTATALAAEQVRELTSEEQAEVKAIESLLGATEEQRKQFRRAYSMMKNITKEEFLRNKMLQNYVAGNQMLLGMREDLVRAFKEEQLGLLDMDETERDRLRANMDLKTNSEKIAEEIEKVRGSAYNILAAETARLGIYKEMRAELAWQAKEIRAARGLGIEERHIMPIAKAWPAPQFVEEARRQAEFGMLKPQQFRPIESVELRIDKIEVEVNAQASEIGTETAKALRAALSGPLGELQNTVKKIMLEGDRALLTGQASKLQAEAF